MDLHQSVLVSAHPFITVIILDMHCHQVCLLLRTAVVFCPALEPPARGSIAYSVDTGIFSYGVTATYSCDIDGEGMSGGISSRMCSPDGDEDDVGQWSQDPPSCESKKIIMVREEQQH